MNLYNFRKEIYLIEKKDKKTAYVLFKIEYLKLEYKKIEYLLSEDEKNYCKRILFNEVIEPINSKIKDKFIDSIFNRRSIRSFGGGISDKEVFWLVQSALYAPSSFNRQSLEFLFTRNKMKINHIAKIKKQSFIRNCNSLIIILCDMKAYKKNDNYYHLIDSGLAIQNILLTSHYFNIAMCFISLKNDYIKLSEYFDIPDNLKPIGLLPCGYKIENKLRPGRKKIKIHYEEMEGIK